MRVDHVLHRVRDDLARRQRVQHAVVAHRDAVVDGDGVELLGHAADAFDLARDQLARVLQVHVAGHELGERIGDRDDRLVEVAIGHAGGAPQRAGAGHVAAVRWRSSNGTRASACGFAIVRGGLEALILLGFHGFRCNRRSCEIGISRPVDTTARRMVFSLHVATPHIATDPTDRPCGVRSSYSSLLPRPQVRDDPARKQKHNARIANPAPKGAGFFVSGPQKKNHHATIEPNPGQTQ
jgi:hypothetical protein